MSAKEKIIVLNGKKFVVGNSKIKPTKCHDYNNPNRKKLLSKEEQIRQKVEKKKIQKKRSNKIKRQSKRLSRKRRD